MELHVRRWNNIWYPVKGDIPHDSTIDVPDSTAGEYHYITERFFSMSDAIEAQIHGTE